MTTHGAATPSTDGGRRAVVVPGAADASPADTAPLRDHAVLRTARLELRPVSPADLEELWQLHHDPSAFLHDSTPPLGTRAQMRWVLGQWLEQWDRDGIGYRTVRPRTATGAAPLYGVVGLSVLAADPADGSRRSADPGSPPAPDSGPTLGARSAPDGADRAGGTGGAGGTDALPDLDASLSAYWRLNPDHQGRGHASEALTAVLAHRPPGREVIAVTDRDNARSRALAARLGFVPAPAGRPVPGGRPGDVLLVLPGAGA